MNFLCISMDELPKACQSVVLMALNNCEIASRKLLRSWLPDCLYNDIQTVISGFVFDHVVEKDEYHIAVYSNLFDKIHGKYRLFYHNSNNAVKCEYNNGKKNGIYLAYAWTNHLVNYKYYVDNYIHGHDIQWWYNGKINQRGKRYHGNQHGDRIVWFPSGCLMLHYQYLHGTLMNRLIDHFYEPIAK